MFNNIIIVGMGQMGGSLAMAIKKYKLSKKVIGYDISQPSLDHAVKNKLISHGETDLQLLGKEKLGAKDMIIIAAHLSATEEIVKSIDLSKDMLIMEIGSAKSYIYGIYKHHLANTQAAQNFIPVHPLAGKEKNGFANAQADLFEQKKCILVPLETNNPTQVYKVAEFWQAINCSVSYMALSWHDKVFSYTSHLPHLLAYSLMETMNNERNYKDLFNYSGGGLQDFTRIASSDENMWADIFMANRQNLLRALGNFQILLGDTRASLQSNDKQAIIERIKQSRKSRKFLEVITDKAEYKDPSDETDYIVSPSEALQGELTVDEDKSISHRSVIIGSLANGTTTISNFLPAEDTINTLNICRELGANIKASPNYRTIKIKGGGIDSLSKADHGLDCGNSGTAARLLCGLLSAQQFSSQICGDPSLNTRPMARVIKPLTKMGATIYARNDNGLPLLIMGKRQLNVISYTMPIASAQIKSAIILAALYTKGQTVIKGARGTRDHTERMLKNFGYKLDKAKNGDVAINGLQKLNAATVNIPADISSAAFFMVAAVITPNSSLQLKNVGINPTRTGIIDILKAMGADLEVVNQRQFGNEPVADIHVNHSEIKGIDIRQELVTLAIDEMPIVMIAAAYAKGTTRISGAAELRVKETDRIVAMVDGLKKINIKAKATADGAVIEGGKPDGGEVDSYKDHRIAMSFAIAACASKKPIHITRCANVRTSFPNFVSCANKVGIAIEELTQS